MSDVMSGRGCASCQELRGEPGQHALQTQNRAGFLLVEMITALGILALLVLVAAQYQAAIAQQRADIALYLKMTQQARTVFEEVLSCPRAPTAQSSMVDGMTIALSVRIANSLPGQTVVSGANKKKEKFFILDLSVSGKTNTGIMRTTHFTSGLCRVQEAA